MPLDSHSYLVSQGWGGKGTGLRQGAISRPLAIPQKKTLAGLGKDRDEAFPFWDHLFTAASKSIQIKCLNDDDDEEEDTNSSNDNDTIKRTSTGIFSNRRPIDGTPASSGTNTPENAPQSHRLGLLATAKRDAAKRGLYSKFFRGPVLGPDTIIEEEKRLAALVSQSFSSNNSIAETLSVQEIIENQTVDKNVPVNLEASKFPNKKRKSCETKETGPENEDENEETKRERKRRKKEKKERKEKKAARHATERRHKKDKQREKTEDTSCTLGKLSPPPISQKDQKVEDVRVTEKVRSSGNATDHLSDRKRLKKEEKRLKALEKTQVKDAENLETHGSKFLESNSSGKQTKPEEIGNATTSEAIDKLKKRKKKRKHGDAE